MWDPSALAEEDIDEMVHSAEQPGGTRAILEMYRARPVTLACKVHLHCRWTSPAVA